MRNTKVSSNYQVFLPKDVRDTIGIEKNDKINWHIVDNRVYISRAKTPLERIQELAGSGHGNRSSDDIDKWLAEERESWE